MVIAGIRPLWSVGGHIGPQSMPSSFSQWRALAVLGALLSIMLVWPFCCCSARPLSPVPANTSVSTLDDFRDLVLNGSSHHVPNSSLPVLSRTERSVTRRGKKQRDLDRNERSANLSHITGVNRKIQLYIKNRFLQILPDGSVNGTHDDTSDYTILQRTTVDIGQIKIQSVATCLFLCMDQCGSVYGSAEFSEDCVFNESMEQHHFNTYSSSHHSNSRRTLYLALNRHGVPRKVQIPPSRPLGNLATYTKSLTQTVEQSRVEQLVAQNFGPTYVKHGLKQLCDSGKQIRDLTTSMRARPKCNQGGTGGVAAKLKKTEKTVTKKKKRRKCRDDEPEGEHCTKSVAHSPAVENLRRRNPAQRHKCSSSSNDNNEEDCGNNLGGKKQQKSQGSRKPAARQALELPNKAKKPNHQQIYAIKKLKPKLRTTTTTPAPSTTPVADEEEDFQDPESDEYDDHIGQSVQFVDDLYDDFQL